MAGELTCHLLSLNGVIRLKTKDVRGLLKIFVAALIL